MGKSSAPSTPDFTGATQLQGQISQENLNTQNYANRPSVYTPFGSQTWSTQAQKDPATGQTVTGWQQNVSLNPTLQSALDSQMNLQAGRSDLANNFLGRVGSEYSQPMDYNSLPALTSANAPSSLQTRTTDYTPGVATGFNFGPQIPQIDSSYRDNVANQLMQKMQPVHDYQTRQLETKLANQGLRAGSEAYNRAATQLGQQQALERYNALDQAGNEAQRLFGMQMQSAQQGYNQNLGAAQFNNQAINQASALDLARMQAQNQAQSQQFGLNQQYANSQNQLRQQAIAEQAQRRGMSLNEMNALLSGQQVQMPSFPGFSNAGVAQAPNYLGALQSQYDANLGATNAANAQTGNLISGLGSLGSAYFLGPGAGAFRF